MTADMAGLLVVDGDCLERERCGRIARSASSPGLVAAMARLANSFRSLTVPRTATICEVLSNVDSSKRLI
jgi:hypothetical protein